MGEMPYKAQMNLTNIPSTQRVPPEAPDGAHLPKSIEHHAGIYLWEPPRTAPTQLLCCTTNPRAGGIASRADKICSYIPIYRSCFSSLILPLSGVVEIAFACVACTKGCTNKGPADEAVLKPPSKGSFVHTKPVPPLLLCGCHTPRHSPSLLLAEEKKSLQMNRLDPIYRPIYVKRT